MSTFVAFHENYLSSCKAQFEVQATQFKDFKNSLNRLSGLVSELKMEKSALWTVVDILTVIVASIERVKHLLTCQLLSGKSYGIILREVPF